jgi:hypothetical protein
MFMSYRLIQILSEPEWCGKALQAERISSQNFGGLTACVELLKIQLKALATNSFIFGGVIALCLLTLIVIVIAGGGFSSRQQDRRQREHEQRRGRCRCCGGGSDRRRRCQ